MHFFYDINGTQINYYFHCKTQLWLFSNRINLEDNSEDVRIGRILHEIDEEKAAKAEIQIENVKVDKITKDYLVEIKKSDTDPEAVKWQVLLYLYKLKNKGIIKKGKIEYIENRTSKKTQIVELNEENEKALLEILDEIKTILDFPTPPVAKFERKCKKCAYFEYCFI